jgi:hypothetical protein
MTRLLWDLKFVTVFTSYRQSATLLNMLVTCGAELLVQHEPKATAAILNLGPGGSWIVFRGWEKITTLFLLTCNWNLASHAVMNVDNKVIFGL